MKYALLVLTEPVADPVPEDKDIEAWVDTHDASGARVWGDRFADAAEAKTVRVRQDGVHVTDGPFPWRIARSRASTFSNACR